MKLEVLFFFVFLAVGALSDFLLNGVLKIVWAVVYVPVYFALIKTIQTILKRQGAVVGFVAGVILLHVVFASRETFVTYSMVLGPPKDNWVELVSGDFPQRLLVVSPRVEEELSKHAAKEPIPILVKIKSSYGCVLKSSVEKVAGIDVATDPKSSWTWKVDGSPASGPGTEDAKLPWCRIHFYRL